MSEIKFLSKDQNYQNESTSYWFDVDGETWGVVESGNDSKVVDYDGYPVNLDSRPNIHVRYLGESVTDEMRGDF